MHTARISRPEHNCPSAAGKNPASHPAWMARQDKGQFQLGLSPDLQVIEVDSAEFLVGDLFRRRFETDSFPQEPRHFVALAKMDDGTFLPLGYVHYSYWNGCALCGGLVMDDRNYRRLSSAARKAIRAAGGIAELLLGRSFSMLPNDLLAIWGHVGNPQSEKVCLRVGFVRVNSPYLMAVWRDERLSEADRADLVRQAEMIGPF